MKDTTVPGGTPTTSNSRQAGQGKRLADPSQPLSVDEMRDYKGVRAAVYFLRNRQKKASYRAVARVFQAVDNGLRSEIIRAYLRRLTALESLIDQGRTHAGRTRDAVPDALLSTTGRSADSVTGRDNRVSSITENVNIKTTAVLREPTEGEREVLDICLAWSRGEDQPPMPQHLLHLYNDMKAPLGLPRRPGT